MFSIGRMFTNALGMFYAKSEQVVVPPPPTGTYLATQSSVLFITQSGLNIRVTS
jgi:hypothetical protein